MANKDNYTVTIMDWIGCVISALSCICSISSIVLLISGRNNIKLTVFLIFSLIICIAASAHTLIRQNKLSKDRLLLITKSLHDNSHIIRDELSILDNYLDKGKVPEIFLNIIFKNTIKESLNLLSESLSKFTGQNIHACIKIYKTDSNTTLTTLARSKNTQNDRFTENDVIIEKVEDYSQILLGNKSYYYNKCIDETNYINNNYRRCFYVTKIVVPIRVKIDDKKINFLTGFICIDCLKPKIFDKYFAIYLCLLNGFADNLYNFFREFNKNSTDINTEVAIDENNR